jgi:small subunit ribosomal protein S17
MANEERQENEKQEPEADQESGPAEAEGSDPTGTEEGSDPTGTEEPDDDAPGEEPAAEEPAEEEAPAEAPAEGPPAEAAPAADAEPEDTHPKAVRKRLRAQASTEPKPQRSPEERAADREARRRGAAARRRRYREGRRAKRGEPGSGTLPAEREPVARRVRQGTVVSSKGDKSITVKVELVGRHRRYEKVVRRTRTLHVHDEGNQAGEGDIVRVVETRPLSRTKRWRLVEILERAR